jgi:hypothetical protein
MRPAGKRPCSSTLASLKGYVLWSAVCTVLAVSTACVAVLAFKAGAQYGVQRTVEGLKQKLRNSVQKPDNPHYRRTGFIYE